MNVVYKISSWGWFVSRINFIVFVQLIRDQQNSFYFPIPRTVINNMLESFEWCWRIGVILSSHFNSPQFKLQEKTKRRRHCDYREETFQAKMLNSTCTSICFPHILLSRPTDKSLILVILNKCVRPLMSVEFCCCCFRSFTYQPHVSRGYKSNWAGQQATDVVKGTCLISSSLQTVMYEQKWNIHAVIKLLLQTSWDRS